jgi:hypothetical protein
MTNRMAERSASYEGRFCSGEGDTAFLRLIDESFAFFNPNAIVPNMTMVYWPERDALVEAGGWDGWWIQNSYGFAYAVTPYLQEPWFTLPDEAWVEVVTGGGWPMEPASVEYAREPALVPEGAQPELAPLPESFKKPVAVLTAMAGLLAGEEGAGYERAFVTAALAACEDCRLRRAIEPGPGYFRPITPKRKAALDAFYEKTALDMFRGFAGRMAMFAEKGDPRQKRVAEIFARVLSDAA